MQFHILKRLVNDGADGVIAEPFMVGRNRVPGSMRGAALRQGIFVRREVFTPVFAFAKVERREFPVLFGVGQPRLKTAELFFLTDVQEKLQDPDSVLGELLLEIVALRVAL